MYMISYLVIYAHALSETLATINHLVHIRINTKHHGSFDRIYLLSPLNSSIKVKRKQQQQKIVALLITTWVSNLPVEVLHFFCLHYFEKLRFEVWLSFDIKRKKRREKIVYRLDIYLLKSKRCDLDVPTYVTMVKSASIP